MQHAQMITAITAATGERRTDVIAVLDALTAQIETNMKAGKRTIIRGFGVFYGVTRENHSVRNVRTGLRSTMPPYISPQFWPSGLWRTHLND